MTITNGTRFGHYEVTAPLGKGGMGEVCLTEDTRLQRKALRSQAVRYRNGGTIKSLRKRLNYHASDS